jgi:hypothetical protein
VVEFGRHAWLRAMWEFPVRVQVPPWAKEKSPVKGLFRFKSRDHFYLTLFLNQNMGLKALNII